jgi:hypothetical protein
MATTTPNYGWVVPTSTDLVKDGATAIETLGDSVDSTVFNGLTKVSRNAQTGTTYTLALTDAGGFVDLNNASAITLTVPTNATVAFPANTRIDILQSGAGQVTIAAAGGVTINSKGSKLKISEQWAAATLVQRSANSWVLIGDLSS